MRNGPQSISMFRLSSIALGFLAVAAFAQNARATPIFATQAELTTAFGGPDATLDWQAFAPITNFNSSTGTFIGSPTTFTLPTIGNVRVSTTALGTLQRKVAGFAEPGVLDGVHSFPGAFTPNTGAAADREQLLQMFGGTEIRFEFLDGPIGGFGTTLQTNTGGGAAENTYIQAIFTGPSDPNLQGPDTSGQVPGNLGTTAFLGARSITNEITEIVITTANNNFAINSPTFFMNSTATGVPEPGTWLMMGLGSLLYGVGKRRKKKNVIVEETV